MSCRGRSHKKASAYRNCLKDNGTARTAMKAAPRQIHVYTFKSHWLIVSNLVFYAQSTITVISGRYSLKNILYKGKQKRRFEHTATNVWFCNCRISVTYLGLQPPSPATPTKLKRLQHFVVKGHWPSIIGPIT